LEKKGAGRSNIDFRPKDIIHGIWVLKNKSVNLQNSEGSGNAREGREGFRGVGGGGGQKKGRKRRIVEWRGGGEKGVWYLFELVLPRQGSFVKLERGYSRRSGGEDRRL